MRCKGKLFVHASPARTDAEEDVGCGEEGDGKHHDSDGGAGARSTQHMHRRRNNARVYDSDGYYTRVTETVHAGNAVVAILR